MSTRRRATSAWRISSLLSSGTRRLIWVVSLLAMIAVALPAAPGPAAPEAAGASAAASRLAVSRPAATRLATSRVVASRLAISRLGALRIAVARLSGLRVAVAGLAALRGAVVQTAASRMAAPASRGARAGVGAAGPASLPPLAPSLGPAPIPGDCLFWHRPEPCYYILRPGFLTFTASPHVLHVGQVISGHLHFYGARFSGWGWGDVAAQPGLHELSHCPTGPGPGNGAMDVTCTWQAVAPTGGWVVFGPTLFYAGSNPYQAGSFYTVVDTNTIVLDGYVRDDDGNPITQTNVLISGPQSFHAVTNLNGYYDAILRKGTYTVTPLVNPDLMNPGEHVKPVPSADCRPSGSSCLVHLTNNQTANFIVPGCHIEPKELLGWKIDGRCPAHVEDGAAGVKLTPPSSLPGGLTAVLQQSGLVTKNSDGTYTLNYNLPMKDRSHLFLPVVLPDFAFNVGSVGFAAYGNTLDDSGLVIDTAGLTLGSGAQAMANDLHIGAGGVSAGSLELDIDGTTLDASDVQISSSGIAASQATIGLPPVLGGSSVSVSGFSIGADGSVHGTLSGFRLQLGDLYGDVTGMTFTPDGGLSLQSATLHLPIAGTRNGCDFSIGGLTYANGAITLKNASAQVHVSFVVGNVNVDGQGQFSLSASGGTVQYGFTGTAMVSIPGVFTAHASLEIGPEDSSHPSRFHQAAFDATLNHGVPLGNTGLELTSVGGSLATSGTQDHVIYTFGLSGGVATAFDNGALFNGTLTGILATDGNFGLGVTSGTLLRKIQVTARLCARFNTESDTVCTQMLPDHPEIRAAVGAFVEAAGALNATVLGYGATLNLAAFGQVQPGFIQASVTGTASLAVPGWSAQGTFGGQMGRFQGPSGTVLGIKATLNGTVNSTPPRTITRSLFVDQNGNVTSTGVASYTLVQPTPVAAQIVRVAAMPHGSPPPVAPDGATSPSAPSAVVAAGAAAPTATATPAPVITALRIPRGQTDTVVSLTWQAGAPALTLIAPNGRHVTPAHPGAGAYLVTTGASNSVTFYLPHPQAGRWRIRIDNVQGGEGYRLSVQGNAPQPTLTVSVPRRGQTILAGSAHPHTGLLGTLRGGSGAATVALYYTVAAAIGQGHGRVPNYAGKLLAARVPVRHGAWRYTWNTGAVPAGSYHIYATLNNGTGPLVTGYGAGTILVRQPARPAAPRSVRGVQRGAALTVRWRAPASAGLVRGYTVRWRPQGLRGEPWLVRNAGQARRVVLGPTRTDVRYAVQVAAYDVAGHQSLWATARMSGGPRVRVHRAPARHKKRAPVHGKKRTQTHGKKRAPIDNKKHGAAPNAAPGLDGRGQDRATMAGPLAGGLAPGAASDGTGAWAGSPSGMFAGPRTTAPRRAPAAPPVPIFQVSDSSTPQIAYNDAAAIAGTDPSTGRPAQTVRNGVYVPYGRRAPAILHYGPYTDEGRVAKRNRRAACGANPFRVGGKPGPADGPGGTWTSCDEYPFASTIEGGSSAIIRGVAIQENLTQGGQLSAFLQQNANALKQNGGEFKVCVLAKGRQFGACS